MLFRFKIDSLSILMWNLTASVAAIVGLIALVEFNWIVFFIAEFIAWSLHLFLRQVEKAMKEVNKNAGKK